VKILVPVKRVPDPTQKAKVKDGHIDLTGASWIVNTFDEYAIEAALQLRDKLADGSTDTRTLRLPGNRSDIRERSTTVAMHMLRRALGGPEAV